MKQTGIFIALVISILLLSWFFPFWWWVFFIPLAIMALTTRKIIPAFIICFGAGFLSWGGMATYQYLTDSKIIAGRVAQLFGLNQGFYMVLVVALLAALIAAFSGMFGASIRSLMMKEKTNYYY